MKRVSRFLKLLAVPLLGLPGTSFGDASKRFGLAFYGGYGTYSMSDVNEAIETPGAFFPGATVTADEIGGGAAFGGGLRMWRSDRVMIAIDIAHLLAKTDGSAVFMGTPFEGELSVPATSIGITVNYLASASGQLRLGVGAGGAYYFCTGEGSASGSGATFSTDIEGSGFGFHALGVADLPMSEAVHAELGAGYRYAKTTDVTVDGGVLYNADGSKSQVDWSGFMARLGFTFYLSGTK